MSIWNWIIPLVFLGVVAVYLLNHRHGAHGVRGVSRQSGNETGDGRTLQRKEDRSHHGCCSI